MLPSSFRKPSKIDSCSIRFAVAEARRLECLQLLHQAFFGNPDPSLFAISKGAFPLERRADDDANPAQKIGAPKSFVPSLMLAQTN